MLSLLYSIPVTESNVHNHLDQVDFLVGRGTLFFSPQATLAAIVVPIINDESAEPTEFFNIKLLPAVDISLTADLATVFIDDNDGM